jgi:hypothetical protein
VLTTGFEVTHRDAHAELSRLLEVGARASDFVTRVERYAAALIGRPYVSNPLIGDKDRAEQLVTGVSAFDCVTFVETVIALARSDSPAELEGELVRVRYRGGRIAWDERLHYFSDWLLENDRNGVLAIDTRGPGSIRIDARLSVLEGLEPRRTELDVVPKQDLELARARIRRRRRIRARRARLLSRRSPVPRR